QNRTQIKVRPVSGGSDEKTADIFNGLIRNIEAQSKAENAYDAAYDEQVTGGYGGWRVLTEFNDDDSFEQDVKIKPVNSAATSMWFDPAAKEYDKRDAKYGFLTTDMQLDNFRSQFPNAVEVDFSQEKYHNTNCKNWFKDNVIRVAEYWVKEDVMRTVALLSNGKVIDVEDEKKVIDELAAQDITIVKQRKVKSHKVTMYKMNGAEILEGPKVWAGKHIPLIPVFGKVSVIEDKTYVRGITRFAKDPQRIYNYSTSASIEAVALAPKDPLWETPKMRAGHEAERNNFNVKNQSFMTYNPDQQAPGAPQRTGAPQVQSALIQQTQQAMLDIHATTGLEPASMGNSPELKSGKAIQAQQAMGDRGSFIFQDNLSKSIQYTGDILVDLIPKIYDTPRMVRVLGLDGKSEIVNVNVQDLNDFNQPVVDKQTGETVIVNDLSKGKYDVVTETGPAFNTLRQESSQQLIDLMTGSPVFEQLAIDLVAKNLNILDGEELAKRARKMMINQGVADPTEEEIEEMGLNVEAPPDPNQIALIDNVNAQTTKIEADIENQDAKTQQVLVQTQGETIKTLKTLMEAYKAQVEVGIPLGRQEHNNRITQNDIIDDAQNITQEDQPNSEQAADISRQLQQGAITQQ
ncbi:MAG: portal protein, partial [Nitrosomonadaceae bacterium]